MLRILHLLSMLAAVLLMLAGSAAAQTTPPQTLRVVSDDNYPPYVFRDESGKLDGYLVDLWHLWESKTGVKVELTATDWARAKALMAEHQAEVIDTIFRTPERESLYDFTPPYADLPVAIYAHSSIGGINTIEALRGFQVGVKEGDACADRLSAAGIRSQLSYPSYAVLVAAAIRNEVKIFCLDEPPANYLLYRAKAHGNFHKAFTLTSGQFHQAVHKGDTATLDLVQRGMARITSDERELLLKKWMGESLSNPQNPYLRYAGFILLGAGLLGVLLAIWITLLRRTVHRHTNELEVQSTFLKNVLGSIPDMVWVKDSHGRYLVANEMTEKFLGLVPGSMEGKTDADLFPPEVAAKVRDADQQVLTNNQPLSMAESMPSADGMLHALETTKKPMHDATGNLLGVLGIAHDVTRQRESDDALREAQRAALLGSFVFDLTADRWTGSDYLSEVLGIDTSQPHTANDWLALIHPDERAALREYLYSYVVAQRENFDLEYRIVNATNQGIHWIHGLGKLDFNEQGEPVGMRGTLQDITRRKAIEEELRASEERLRLAQSSAGLGLWDLNVASGITSWSAEVEALYGLPAGHFAKNQDSWLRHLHPDDRDPVRAAIGRHMHSRTPFEIEFRIIHASGEIRWLASRGQVHFDDHGEPTRVIGVNFDITARKRDAEELARYRTHLEEVVADRTAELALARDEAQAANRAKSIFLANMSHEIRTPMNAILGMAHLILREGVSPRQAERLGKLDNAAQHLLEIINDILDLSKIEAGKFVLDIMPISIGPIMDDVTSLLRERAAAKGLELRVELALDPEPIRGDSLRIKQALLNYAVNAIKFTEHGHVILRAFSISNNDTSVIYRFEVTDTGIGLDENTLQRLFVNFEQADNSISREYGGTGLGLAITRRLAELMGGQAGVSSQPGVGSTFWFTARLEKRQSVEDHPANDFPDTIIHAGQPTPPEIKANPREAISPSESAPLRDVTGCRVLVVDDDAFNREVTTMLLQEFGAIVDCAIDGQDCLEHLMRQRFDVVLMDIQMPVMDGLEATRRIRSQAEYRELPVIALTANAFPEDQIRCHDAGVSDFLAKPANPQHLLATLRRWWLKLD